MQSTNPISPARRGSFALALAVTVASLIMGGAVALAEDQPSCTTPGPRTPTCQNCTCTHQPPSQVPPTTLTATFKIKNTFSATNQLYGSIPSDSDFWIYCKDDGKGTWYYQDSCGAYWQFGTGCFVPLSEIKNSTIYLASTATGAAMQAVYWPQTSAPSNPPLDTAPASGAPNSNTGNYAGHAQFELTADATTNNTTKSNIDITLLNSYTFAHQLLYWKNNSCLPPTAELEGTPDVATGFNGVLSSADIYSALTTALGTGAVGDYYPANYPDDSLMMLNGESAVSDWSNYVYNRQTEEWTQCPSGGDPLQWGLPQNYRTESFQNGVSSAGAVAQNFPIDTGDTGYSTSFGVWHPSKSITTQYGGVRVAQTFGSRYGGDAGYLKALHDSMPQEGYKMNRNIGLPLEPGSPEGGYVPVIGCNGYSFSLFIVQTNFGDDKTPLNDYHIELRDIRVFTLPDCGTGFSNDPVFAGGDGVWYPKPNLCGTAQDYSMYNAPRGRAGVPTDPLMCLLLEGQCPAPNPSLSEQYDYPYVYDQIVVVPPSPGCVGVYGTKGGPVLKDPANDPYTLLKDEYDAQTNPHGTGRTFSPPGLSAFRQYLLEDGVKQAVAGSFLSDIPAVVFDQNPPTSTSPKANQGTIVYQFQTTQAGAPGNSPLLVNCIGGGIATTESFCDGYNGNYSPNGTLSPWTGQPTFGSGLRSWQNNTGLLPSCFGMQTGQPFTWAGPFYTPATSSIAVSYYVCTDPHGCGLPYQGPGDATAGPANGWVKLPFYPKPLHKSKFWSWPPYDHPVDPPPTTAGVELVGTFNWDGSRSLTAGPANIKIGTNGYPEAYFASPPKMQWKNTYTGQGPYNASTIPWNNQWHGGNPWFYPAFVCGPTALPTNGLPGQPSFGGGAIVPNLGNWTDYFLNLGGAPTVSLVMYSNNYSPSSPNAPTNGGTAFGPCPDIKAKPGSQGLFGFDPFIKVTNWPMAGDPVEGALKGSGVTDVTLEGYFSQELIAAMMGDVSTVIQYGLLNPNWNSGYGFEYYTNALGSPTVPLGPDSIFQNPSSTHYTGPRGNAFVEALLKNSLGYHNNRGNFPATTKVVPPYVTTYSDRFKQASPDFQFIPGSSYFQWNLGVPLILPIADIDGNGCVGSEDLTMLLAAWGACGKGKCPEDLNKDGIVEGGDLVHVLAEWGVGCGSP